jgi:hypothetical protein
VRENDKVWSLREIEIFGLLLLLLAREREKRRSLGTDFSEVEK